MAEMAREETNRGFQAGGKDIDAPYGDRDTEEPTADREEQGFRHELSQQPTCPQTRQIRTLGKGMKRQHPLQVFIQGFLGIDSHQGSGIFRLQGFHSLRADHQILSFEDAMPDQKVIRQLQ